MVHPVVLRNRCLWASEQGKTCTSHLGPVMLATKLIVKVYMSLSPGRSMVPKSRSV